MIQELSGDDPTKYPDVLRVRVRDGLEAFVARMKDRAQRAYDHQVSIYAAGALKKKPKLPKILEA